MSVAPLIKITLLLCKKYRKLPCKISACSLIFAALSFCIRNSLPELININSSSAQCGVRSEFVKSLNESVFNASASTTLRRIDLRTNIWLNTSLSRVDPFPSKTASYLSASFTASFAFLIFNVSPGSL